MSVNFYNTKGWMVGLDGHDFYMAVPPDPAPVWVPFFLYVVGLPLSWGICDQKSIVQTVGANGAKVLQKGHKKKMVPHIFVPCALPHPVQAAHNAVLIAKSRTTCVMGVAGVTGGGTALATCLAGGWGLNENCFAKVRAPSGHVFNPNTVRTSPTAADYVNAAIDCAMSIAEKLLPKPIQHFFKGLKGIDSVVKYIEKKISPSPSAPRPFSWNDFDKKDTKAREEYVRKLLGGL